MILPVTAFISPGGSELIVIMLVLILLFGAKDAPRILRAIQTALDKLQRAAADFRYKLLYSDLYHKTSSKTPEDTSDYPEDDEKDAKKTDVSEPPAE